MGFRPSLIPLATRLWLLVAKGDSRKRQTTPASPAKPGVLLWVDSGRLMEVDVLARKFHGPTFFPSREAAMTRSLGSLIAMGLVAGGSALGQELKATEPPAVAVAGGGLPLHRPGRPFLDRNGVGLLHGDLGSEAHGREDRRDPAGGPPPHHQLHGHVHPR